MDTRVAVGLIVLTAFGTYLVAHPRRHHFEPVKGRDPAVLLDTDRGILCSARFGTKWTEENKKAVAEASLAAQEAHQKFGAAYNASPALRVEETYGSDKTGRIITTHCDDKCGSARDEMEAADANYWTTVKKANAEGLLDTSTSGMSDLPLCKDVR